MNKEKLSEVIYQLSNTISFIEVLVDYCEYNSSCKEIAKMHFLLEYTCKESLRLLDELDSIEVNL